MSSNLPAALLALAASVAFGQQKPAYSDAEAGKHVGEEATVIGKVFNASTSGRGTTFLNFGDRYPRQTFGAVVFAGSQAAVGDVKRFEGQEVAVTGRIEVSPDHKPQIVIRRPDQIKFAGPAIPAAPAAPASAPVAATPMQVPSPPAAKPPEKTSSPPASGKIELAMTWNSSRRGGETVRKDLARLFGEVGSASETTRVDTSMEIYPGVAFLSPLANAKRALNLGNSASKKIKVTTPGFPQDSFTAHVFDGVFPGGFTRLYLVADNSDQIVSVLLVDSSGRTRVPNDPDTTGYHTYNFVTGDWKATGSLVIRHAVAPAGSGSGVILVDTLLIDPTDPEFQPPIRSTKGGSSRSGSYPRPKTGRVIERSRWFVPAPIVNLILRCVGG